MCIVEITPKHWTLNWDADVCQIVSFFPKENVTIFSEQKTVLGNIYLPKSGVLRYFKRI